MRRIKTAGLVGAMVLALAALGGVSSASAAETNFNSESTNTAWQGTGLGTHTLNLGGLYASVHCKSASLSGVTTSRSFSQLAASPALSSCNSGPNAATVNMNGCSYVLSANTGALSIQGCAAITTTVLGNCAVSIPPQILGTVSYVNQGSGEGREILAKASLKGIEFTVTGCIPKWTFNNGTYTGEWLLKGTINGTSVPTGVWVG